MSLGPLVEPRRGRLADPVNVLALAIRVVPHVPLRFAPLH
jgi:hypothetical protein